MQYISVGFLLQIISLIAKGDCFCLIIRFLVMCP